MYKIWQIQQAACVEVRLSYLMSRNHVMTIYRYNISSSLRYRSANHYW